MSLFYPPGQDEARGKTTAKEDRFIVKFLEREEQTNHFL